MTANITPTDPGEKTLLERYNPDRFPRHSLAVDVAALSTFDGDLWALIIQRQSHPFREIMALPGGFIGLDESLGQAAARILDRETGLKNVFLEQLYTFGDPGRDPRTRIIAVAYYALIDWERMQHLKSQGHPMPLRLSVPWAGVSGGPVQILDQEGNLLPLAFDHAEILGMAVKRIRGKLDYVPIGFQLLPSCFSLRQLQEVHETILNQKLNKDSFRRRMLASGLLKATGELEEDVDHRPAELYRFTRKSAI